MQTFEYAYEIGREVNLNRVIQYLKKKGTGVLIVAVIVAVIFGVSITQGNGKAGALENASVSLAIPSKKSSSGFVGWLQGIYSYMFQFDTLKAENEELKIKLAESQTELRKAKSAIEENKRLRDLFDLSDRHEDLTFEDAMIIDRGNSNWNDTYTIDKGQESDIRVGDCVVDSQYNLVGQVIELGLGWATVRSVCDADMHVGALVGENGNAAMIIGDFALMQDGNTKLTYLTDETQVLEGDAILTSGKGGTFPRNLVIGEITDVRTEDGGQMKYAIVTPSASLDSLTQVFVVKDFDLVE